METFLNLDSASTALEQLSSRIATPFYLLDLNGIRSTFESHRKAWSHLHEQVEIAYSFKTNPLKDITRLLESLGASSEVTTEKELNWALEDGYSPQRITLGGPAKTDNLLLRAYDLGVNIHFDSRAEHAILASRYNGNRKGRVLGPRLAHRIQNGCLSRFGLTTNELQETVLGACNSTSIINGLHFHVGSNLNDASQQLKALCEYLPIVHTVARQSVGPVRLSLGGGYPASLPPTSMESYIKDNFVTPLRLFLTATNCDSHGMLFLIEPGRSLVQHNAVLVGSVLDVKERDERILLFLDVGRNLVPSSAQQPLMIRTLATPLSPVPYRCCGPQCFESDYVGDLIGDSVAPRRGDRIVIEHVGGYDMSTAVIWSRPEPQIFTCLDGEIRSIDRSGRLARLA